MNPDSDGEAEDTKRRQAAAHVKVERDARAATQSLVRQITDIQKRATLLRGILASSYLSADRKARAREEAKSLASEISNHLRSLDESPAALQSSRRFSDCRRSLLSALENLTSALSKQSAGDFLAVPSPRRSDGTSATGLQRSRLA